MSFVYLLHFDRPIAPGRHTTQHYIGHADDLARRIDSHRRGRYQDGSGCAKLCAVAKERGIGFRVARLWRGGYELERRLKGLKAGRRLCPVCGRELDLRPLPLKYAEEVPAGEIEDLLLPF